MWLSCFSASSFSFPSQEHSRREQCRCSARLLLSRARRRPRQKTNPSLETAIASELYWPMENQLPARGAAGRWPCASAHWPADARDTAKAGSNTPGGERWIRRVCEVKKKHNCGGTAHAGNARLISKSGHGGKSYCNCATPVCGEPRNRCDLVVARMGTLPGAISIRLCISRRSSPNCLTNENTHRTPHPVNRFATAILATQLLSSSRVSSLPAPIHYRRDWTVLA